jgi:OOP family OmpA-OmpF porin
VYETYRIFLSDSMSVCAGPYPTFDFDSAKLDTEEQPSMRNLAQCMKTGPLQNKHVLLTGKTDPRGTDAYNDKLGLERAERVKRYLLAQGIASDRVLTKSVGESESSPLPKDWPQDRHVQVSSPP